MQKIQHDKNLDRRIASLEARQPPVKSDWQRFLEKLTDDELNRLGTIVEKNEIGEELNAIESVFLDELETTYAPVQELE